MTDEERLARDIIGVLPPSVWLALCYCASRHGGQRPTMTTIIEAAEHFGVHPGVVAGAFGYGIPRAKSIRTDRPHDWIDLLEPGAVARGPQSRDHWLTTGLFLATHRAPVVATRLN
jgi:hypothetical protein